MNVPPVCYSHKRNRITDSPISYFMKMALENPHLISLAAGLVDEGSLPAAAIARATDSILGNPATAKAALQYGTTQGNASLRDRVLRHICAMDGVTPEAINLSANDVVLTTGSQQLLYLVGEILLDPGDIVITEAPSYFVYHSLLQTMDVRVLTVPMDGEGMDLQALEERLHHLEKTGQLDRLKLIYTVDYFQNPTGLSLSTPRRQKLVELAKRYSTKHRILILEDAAYRELRFEGPDLPSIKRYDETNEFVISSYTFSKPCAPGLKIGYGLMPQELVGPIVDLKGSHDFGSSNFSQVIIERLMQTGEYHQHVEELAKTYRRKRDAMLAALQSNFSDWPEVRWTTPAGGLYVWLSFPESINTGPEGTLVGKGVEEGVLYVPGEFGHVAVEGNVPTNEARLSYGVVTVDRIPEAIRRLRRAADQLGLSPQPLESAHQPELVG
ncbi:aminotransferase-like domain-containing protein [Tuwongella immobilis]|uniref:Aminotransferase class I/classII large domain-containing protein n=1 Tax=Tuwongella immobilis TaxID=692036 RepID=A0A6C2YTI9_9BACT|nr:PLP-dependent aminotransferase family protein [Tuwongella immobilis]VIP04202.1 family transcriptional regulator : Aminotransferase OS=Planctomyces maris DSM 8797 GN=PM8797T_10829 PE=4 SV=1: Aminotran_1_2 [Tuwongella immobilis]VTS05768.1 family transcriptional regulator : Aminotransferase OS=Planctomyces maris DSM 8797 GN=PM8797T_10829 PE=4 SV=1: Aminotran_1_2 [Tuwongella immobilis]